MCRFNPWIWSRQKNKGKLSLVRIAVSKMWLCMSLNHSLAGGVLSPKASSKILQLLGKAVNCFDSHGWSPNRIGIGIPDNGNALLRTTLLPFVWLWSRFLQLSTTQPLNQLRQGYLDPRTSCASIRTPWKRKPGYHDTIPLWSTSKKKISKLDLVIGQKLWKFFHIFYEERNLNHLIHLSS